MFGGGPVPVLSPQGTDASVTPRSQECHSVNNDSELRFEGLRPIEQELMAGGDCVMQSPPLARWIHRFWGRIERWYFPTDVAAYKAVTEALPELPSNIV